MENIILECECCGGTFQKVSEGQFKCDHCGYVKYVETTTSNEIISLLNQANTLRNKGEFDDACEIYQTIVQKDGKNPEGYWGLFLSEYGIMHVQDPKTGKFVPTCNRASISPVTNDENLKTALELSNPQQREDLTQKAEQIEKIRAKILTLSKNEQPYDVFICYKRTASIEGGKETYTEDAQQAREIYDILSGVGYKVFFAEKTLQNLAGSEYEPIIFHALNTSKVMLVVCSDINYINAPWVKNEWRRFIKQMEYDEDKKLIPVMAGGMKAGRLPDLLKKYQGLEINVSFKDNLLESLKRNIDAKRKNGISRVTLGGVKTAKRSASINSSFQTRTLGTKAASDVVASDEKLLKIAFSYFEKGMFKDAKTEFAQFKDSRNYEKLIDFMFAFIDGKRRFTPEIVAKFNDTIPTVSKERAEYLFALLEKEFDEIVLKRLELNQIFDERSAMLYETIMSWDRPKKNEYTKRMMDLCMEKPFVLPKNNNHRLVDPENKDEVFISKIENKKEVRDFPAVLNCFEAIAKCFDTNNVDGYIELLTTWAINTPLHNRKVKEFCYKKILEVDEGNIGIRYQAYIDEIEGINKLPEGIEETENRFVKEFKAFLQYVDEKVRVKYIEKELERTFKQLHVDTVRNKSVDYGDIVFDAVIKLLPEKETNLLVKYLYKKADQLRTKSKWDKAIEYYQNILSEKEKEYKAYWGILLCKMKAVDDDATLLSTHRIDEFPEFASALKLAPDTVADKYIALKQLQAVKVRSNKRSKRMAPVWGILIALAILGVIGLAAWGVIALVGWLKPVVTFVDWDGTYICEVEADGWFGAVDLSQIDTSSMTKPEDDIAYSYTFDHWQGNTGKVWHRTTVKAVYKGDFKMVTLTIDWSEVKGREMGIFSSLDQLRYEIYDDYDIEEPGKLIESSSCSETTFQLQVHKGYRIRFFADKSDIKFMNGTNAGTVINYTLVLIGDYYTDFRLETLEDTRIKFTL